MFCCSYFRVLAAGDPRVLFAQTVVVWGESLLEHYLISLVCVALEKHLGSMTIEVDSSQCSPQEGTQVPEKESLVGLTLKVTLWSVGLFLGGGWSNVVVVMDLILGMLS